MDLDESNALGGAPLYIDKDSGSTYETSDAEQSSSPNEQIEAPNSRTISVRGTGGRSASQKSTRRPAAGTISMPNTAEKVDAEIATHDPKTRSEALEWAAKFLEPQSPGDIKTPTRKPARGSAKRKLPPKEPSVVREKRLKAYYSAKYRELLNADINDITAQTMPGNQNTVQGSQIGSSIWTSKEKITFFTALSRLGGTEVKEIATRIGTKSEFEVQEYLQLLQKSLLEQRIHGGLLGLTDFPAAVEISEECSTLLERAGDALASRQERHEEGVEHAKWGDSWLLTSDVSHWVDRHRRQEGGEEAINEVLPAANLLILKNWLELSSTIFMNPAAPYEEENWHNLAEDREEPAIRATAFEDFHSLAVNITKKLISTTLFCTMSRERATHANKSKHGDITTKDVEAAVNILKLKPNSKEFWTKCGRRCKIQIMDDEAHSDAEEATPMTYVEAETALGAIQRSRNRSVSRNPFSSAPSPNPTNADPETLDEYQSADEHYYSSSLVLEDDQVSLSLSDKVPSSSSSQYARAGTKRAKDQKAYISAEKKYTEAFDASASRSEELRLWALLETTPPFDMKPDPLKALGKPKNLRKKIEENGNRMDHLEYWSEWEVMGRPVPEEAFERNRRVRIVRKRNLGLSEEDPTPTDSGDDADEDDDAGQQEREETQSLQEQSDDESEDSIQPPASPLLSDQAMITHSQSLASESRVSSDTDHDMSTKSE